MTNLKISYHHLKFLILKYKRHLKECDSHNKFLKKQLSFNNSKPKTETPLPPFINPMVESRSHEIKHICEILNHAKICAHHNTFDSKPLIDWYILFQVSIYI